MRKIVHIIALAGLLGCAQKSVPPPTASQSADPAPATVAAPSNEPTVVTPNGATIRIEVASNEETRERGLMFRDRLESDRGMLFVFPQSGLYPFWMKNTLIPLDMIWLDEGRKIVRIRAGVPPCQADPCPSYSPEATARYVLELANGRAAALGLREGDVLRVQNIENYRVQ